MITFVYDELILQIGPVLLILGEIKPELPRLTRKELSHSRNLPGAGRVHGQLSHERNAFGNSFPTKMASLNLSPGIRLLLDKKGEIVFR